MNCPTCHRAIPNTGKNRQPLLYCPSCLRERSYRAILAAQRHVIARLVTGAVGVKLTKPADAVRWHIALGEYDQAWCGWALGRWEQKRLAWPLIDQATPLCERCREAFQKLAEEEEV